VLDRMFVLEGASIHHRMEMHHTVWRERAVEHDEVEETWERLVHVVREAGVEIPLPLELALVSEVGILLPLYPSFLHLNLTSSMLPQLPPLQQPSPAPLRQLIDERVLWHVVSSLEMVGPLHPHRLVLAPVLSLPLPLRLPPQLSLSPVLVPLWSYVALLVAILPASLLICVWVSLLLLVQAKESVMVRQHESLHGSSHGILYGMESVKEKQRCGCCDCGLLSLQREKTSGYQMSPYALHGVYYQPCELV